MARSTDEGETWRWSSDGLISHDLWAARSGVLQGREVALVGALPSHVMLSEDDGISWRDLPGLRSVASSGQWFFPPPPRIGHVKDIVIANEKIYVGIESAHY